MKDEIAAAVVFLTRMVKNGHQLNKEQIDEFSDKLTTALVEKFKNHWYTDNPIKGQGYRCIRLNDNVRMEPLLGKVAKECSLNYSDLNLPAEMTLWVDPEEVTCRFGELQGTWCTVASFKKDQDNKQIENVNQCSLGSSTKPKKYGYNKQFYRYSPVTSNKYLQSTGEQFRWSPMAVNVPVS
ncbi:maternal B9.10 protein-like [Glandiceps talaboti]